MSLQGPPHSQTVHHLQLLLIIVPDSSPFLQQLRSVSSLSVTVLSCLPCTHCSSTASVGAASRTVPYMFVHLFCFLWKSTTQVQAPPYGDTSTGLHVCILQMWIVSLPYTHCTIYTCWLVRLNIGKVLNLTNFLRTTKFLSCHQKSSLQPTKELSWKLTYHWITSCLVNSGHVVVRVTWQQRGNKQVMKGVNIAYCGFWSY